MGDHITTVFVMMALVIFSAYFSGTETAFTSFNRIRMKNLADAGNVKARMVLKIAQNYDKLISTILTGNNIVNIALASISTIMFVDLFGSKAGPTVSTLIVTLVILIFAEISPKSIVKEMPEKFCFFSAPFIRVLIFLLTPLHCLFAAWKHTLTKIIKIDASTAMTGEELLTMVEVAETEGGIQKDQSELIQNAIEFNDLEAWDVLTPRVDMAAIEIKAPKDEVSRLFIETGFSRLPVYEETIDRINGVLNQKDFSNYIVNSDREISEFVKPVVFMAGSVKLTALLKRMQKIKTHIAVIVDEYGGTEGIVTMEDIIEELVGEIFDEHDEVTTQEFVQQQDGSYRILCSANVEKMFDYLGIKQEEMDVTTVNGWVVVNLDKIPEAGDSFNYKNLSVTVTRANEKKALEIRVVKDVKEDAPDRGGFPDQADIA